MDAATALMAATAVHAGFQTTVSVLVYPALARLPAAQWDSAHDQHSRAITPLVAVVYAALLLGCGLALVSQPRWWTWASVAAVGVTFVTTTFAARVHARLGKGHDRELIGRLLRIDRVRAVTAVLALVFALGLGHG